MGIEEGVIAVIPIGSVVEMAPKVVAAHITSLLKINARVAAPLAHPQYALDRRRLQYDAALILKAMEKCLAPGDEKAIGVVAVDLFVPIFSFVFGEAHLGGSCAVVSTWRLERNQPGLTVSPALVLERTAKVALHELGHLYRLPHCSDPGCLMHFAGDLDHLDRTPLFFCRYCNAFWQNQLWRY
jgi:archaemetzincin